MEYAGSVVPGPVAMNLFEREQRTQETAHILHVREMRGGNVVMGVKKPPKAFLADHDFWGFENWVLRFVGRLTWDEWDAYFMPWNDLDAAGITWDELESPTSILHLRNYRITPTLRRATGTYWLRISGSLTGELPTGETHHSYPYLAWTGPAVWTLKDDQFLEGSCDVCFAPLAAFYGFLRAEYNPIVSDRIHDFTRTLQTMSQSLTAAAQNENNVYLAGHSAAYVGVWPYLFPGVEVKRGAYTMPYSSSNLLLYVFANYLYPVGLFHSLFFYYPWRNDDPRSRWDFLFVDPNWK